MSRFPLRSMVAALVAVTAVAVAGSPVDAGDAQVAQTRALTYCGTTTWVVPDGVTHLEATVEGAAGGNGKGAHEDPSAAGGRGGRTIARTTVTAGEVLTLVVGCQGTNATWAPDAAAGGTGHGEGGDGGQHPDGWANAGGGGGGGSAILRDDTTPLLVAGGGGGGGADGSGPDNTAVGGDGGGVDSPGGDGGEDIDGCGGLGATLTDPGAGGDGPADGAPGLGPDGGDGAVDLNPEMGSFTTGGGGGGGHFGGGGGGADRNMPCGGGGGGSGYAIAGSTDLAGASGVREGDGRIVLEYLTSVPAPVNDDDASATVLTGRRGTTESVDTTNASPEVAEPAHAGGPPRRSVWYRFVAPFNGRARLDTVASDFDTVLAVYTGDPTTRSFTPVAANDDRPGVTDGASQVTFRIRQGTEYWVAVDGAGGATGTVALTHLLARPRPDARIQLGRNGALRGNNLYGSPTGQSVVGQVRPGGTVTYTATLQNDSAIPERFQLSGQPRAGRFTLRYRTVARVDITNRVTAGTFRTPAVAPGRSFTVRIEVGLGPRSADSSVLARTLRVRSTVQPAVVDTVRFTSR